MGLRGFGDDVAPDESSLYPDPNADMSAVAGGTSANQNLTVEEAGLKLVPVTNPSYAGETAAVDAGSSATSVTLPPSSSSSRSSVASVLTSAIQAAGNVLTAKVNAGAAGAKAPATALPFGLTPTSLLLLAAGGVGLYLLMNRKSA